MYYLYNDTGALIDEYETIELGLGAKSMFPNSILLYYGENPRNNDEPWELGIEIAGTSEPKTAYIGYVNSDYIEGCFKVISDTFEGALEELKDSISPEAKEHINSCYIVRRQTTEYKVKL